MTAVDVPTTLDHEGIRDRIPHRWPVLLLDRMTDIKPGRSARGIKNVASTESWFQGHFPDQAVLPGVVIIESLAQLSGVVFSMGGAGPISFLAGVRSMRFRKPVVPGDQLLLYTERTAGGAGFAEFKVSARVGNTVVAEGSVAISDPSPIERN